MESMLKYKLEGGKKLEGMFGLLSFPDAWENNRSV